MYIPMKISKPEFIVQGIDVPTKTFYPPGAVGCIWVFETSEALVSWHGKDTKIMEIASRSFEGTRDKHEMTDKEPRKLPSARELAKKHGIPIRSWKDSQDEIDVITGKPFEDDFE